jgi:PIN domain nuclease of toxin-antitoxin system
VSGRPILLDTCAAIWLANDDPLASEAEAALAEAAESGGVLVSPITAWEIGLLAARNRIALSRTPLAWFETVIRLGVTLAPMPPSVLADSSYLPAPAPRDPADRIMAATARAFTYRLMTRDRVLLDYGAAGHLDVVAC